MKSTSSPSPHFSKIDRSMIDSPLKFFNNMVDGLNSQNIFEQISNRRFSSNKMPREEIIRGNHEYSSNIENIPENKEGS